MTISENISKHSLKNFNSHPHEEDDPESFFSLLITRNFNSHPHEEDDGDGNGKPKGIIISTHILTKRMTTERKYGKGI